MSKLIIFDFDGTLVDSLDYYLVEARRVFPHKSDILNKKYVHTHGMKHVLNELPFPNFLLPVVLIYIRIRHFHIVKNLKPHIDIEPVLRKLTNDHIVGILSSNSVKTIRVFLDNNNLARYINFVNSSPFLFKKHRKLEKIIKALKHDQVYYIGDEQRDIEAANKAGCVSIAVTWGTESEKLLKNANPDHIISDPKELLKIIK